jgi:hypothetical protein
MALLSKAIRVLVVIVAIFVLAIVGVILVLDPPPFRLHDEDNVVISIDAPKAIDPNLAGSIERGLACNRKLQTDTSGHFGRPLITVFDWLKHQSGKIPERDYHLTAARQDDAWAIKIDRASNKFCWLRASDAAAGITESYCGPRIVREDATRIQAFQDDPYGAAVAVVFDKMTYTVTITGLDWWAQPAGASITYLQCR